MAMPDETIEGYSLSPQQERIWALQQASPGMPYQAWCTISIEGTLELPKLKAALEELSSRHEILRTTFHRLPAMKMPVQVIAPAAELVLPEYDLRELDSKAQGAWLETLMHDAAGQALDLAKGPLLKLSLVKLSAKNNVLVIKLPVICGDRVGLSNLMREIVSIYASLLSGVELSDQPMQYADLAEWQNQLLESDDTKDGREYWQQDRFKTLSVAELPFKKQSSGSMDFDPQSLSSTISSASPSAITELARQYETTMPTFLLTCWQVLLWRLSGQQSDLIVAVGHDGRKYEDLHGALGPLTRYLPVQVQLETGVPFSTLLQQVDRAGRDAYKWQEYFTWEETSVADPIGNLPGYFPFMFEFAEESPTLSVADINFSLTIRRMLSERFQVKLVCIEQAGSLRVELQYDRTYYSSLAMSRLVEQFHHLLSNALSHPGTAIDKLKILTDAERRQLFQWNETAVDYPREKCLHQLVEAQVERTPEAVALIYEDQQLTYLELNQKANQVAHYLRALGIGPEIKVGLYVERSLEMMVGLLGILKAGGAYVPLDPEYPQERVGFMLEDAGVAAIVTTAHLVPGMPPQSAPVVCLDTEWNRFEQLSKHNLLADVDSRNLAYVIYTSGSTGQPKGVTVEHRAINNRLLWMQRDYPLAANDRLLQKTPISFDASIWELFVPLISGAQMVIARPGGHQDSDYLVAVTRDRRVTVLQLVPSMLQVVLDEITFEECRSLRRMYCGGEVFPADLQRRFEERLEAELHNLYGPTEASIDAAHWLCEKGSERRVVPIGKPLANIQLYILDPHGQFVPVGVVGELHIGGVGLARGYLGRPKLTAERFIPNRFSEVAGERLYRTGDNARFLQGGEIEFLGRSDQQVKVRGFRIELGEIETVLSGHPAVHEVVVVARESNPGEKRLIAYLVTKDGATEQNFSLLAQQASLSDELRSYLQDKLPDYMVPSAFVVMDHMPLAPNGKLDRRALPDPDKSGGEPLRTPQLPRTPVEDLLAGIWAEVLGLERTGIHDNFFDLGGHSLLATRLMSRVRQCFAVEVALHLLFETPTVAGLAAVIERKQRAGQGVEEPPIFPTSRDRELPLSFAQQRLWFLDQLEPDSAFYNISTALRLRGPLNHAALEQSINEIVRRHEVLRTTFASLEGRPYQMIAPNLSVQPAFRDLRDLSESKREMEARRLIEEESRRPFDLSRGPLLRTTLLRIGSDEHLALLTMHHIVSDGWSRAVFIGEMAALYQAFSSGTPSPLPELKIQYADYAVWQRDWLQGEVLERQLEYWRERLAGAKLLELPTDKPRPPLQSFNGAMHPFVLSEELTRRLKAAARQENATLFMVLLAAFQVLLARYSGQEDVVVGTPIANRTQVETEDLIGFFVNMLALRTEVRADLCFAELLRRVREMTLSAHAYQDVPFEKLVEELQVERDLSRHPLFQVMFTLQPSLKEKLEIADLQIRGEAVGEGTAKFDLTLIMEEAEPGTVAGAFEYCTDLFEADTIARFAKHFLALLANIADNPSQQISQLLTFDADEKQEILLQWNQTRADYPREVCVHELFEAQAARTAERVAVVYGNEQVTYGELNLRANQLARRLRGLGVRAETPVGIFLERSVEMVVALFGVLKAGGAYVPLDPQYPTERLSYMLEQAKATVVVTEERLLGAVPKCVAQRVCVGTGHAETGESGENLERTVQPENLAYVMYTSGSSGTPKGVMITHGNVVNFLCSMGERPGVNADDVLLSVTSLSFDISGLEIYLPLLMGARLEIVSREAASDGLELRRLLKGSGATIMQATPTTWRLLIEAGWDGGEDLRVLCGGEALPVRLAAELSKRSGEVWNLYGPTETTIWSTMSRVGAGRVTLGGPIANTQVYIVDQWYEPVPFGVKGELCIGGAGVGRGYQGRPALTAEKFIPDPFAAEAGRRLYRTGDLGRYLRGGAIEYLGRMDQQLKVRGYRIEPGEIEAVLEGHQNIREAVVTARHDGHGLSLVAYLVLEGEGAPNTPELRSHLKEKLPEYMVPSAFVILEELPLTLNGKVNRQALPAPEGAASPRHTLVSPRTVIEEMLIGIWAEVLPPGPFGVTDNFFDLGGHSLLATQLLSRLRNMFGIDLPLRLLFQYATIETLGKLLVEHEAKAGQTEKIALVMKKIKSMPANEVPEVLKGKKQARV
jgi:amino acid adenylation domain-containing protein